MIEICQDKGATRPLYEEAFFEDPIQFVDYYYEDKCLDNTIFVDRDDDRIVSMLHLNPYTMSICGHEARVYYVVAVATTASERHKGHITGVFEAAFEHMKKEGVPFCYLMPVDENIYKKLGFETITGFHPEKIEDFAEVQDSYDIYCLRDEDYLRRMDKELALRAYDSEDVDAFPPSPVIMAKVIDLEAMSAAAGSSFSNEKEAYEWLKSKKIYICEEV